MLFVIATPIGHLEDITLRALSTLKTVEYLLCEDTRRTKKLLFHYNLSLPLVSFHLFNEKKKEAFIVADLKKGKRIGLVSDAGMPTISDPGTSLVGRCHQEKIPVTVIPGPSALLTALSLSGLQKTTFQFLGFFPKKLSEIHQRIEQISQFQGISIFFQSPHRLLKTVKALPETYQLIVAKELTKIHETLFSGSPKQILEQLQKTAIRGEYTLLITPS